jgi:hypothetical protein
LGGYRSGLAERRSLVRAAIQTGFVMHSLPYRQSQWNRLRYLGRTCIGFVRIWTNIERSQVCNEANRGPHGLPPGQTQPSVVGRDSRCDNYHATEPQAPAKGKVTTSWRPQGD